MQKVITLIISRNYGPSLSFNIKLSRLVVVSSLLVGMLGVLVYLALSDLVHSSQNQTLEQEIEHLRQEHKRLQKQIHATSQRAYEQKIQAFYAVPKRPLKTRTRSTRLNTPISPENYQAPILVAQATARANRRRFEVVFKLQSAPNTRWRAGGYLFAVFTNSENQPPTHVSSPQAKINFAGFPQYYKYGAYVPPFQRSLLVRRAVHRKNQQRFTHLTLYVFSGHGGLVLRENFVLDPGLFTNSSEWVLRDLQKRG